MEPEWVMDMNVGIFTKASLATCGMVCCVVLSLAAAPDVTPVAIPTFHCIGLYWSPPGGCAEKRVLVRYRREGESGWNEGLPMRYHPIARTDEDLADYRGSIVHLVPGANYEMALSLEGTPKAATITAATWGEDFPVGETVRVASGDAPLAITESGSPGAYRIYDGRGATIDVRHKHDSCVTINASHVILRGLKVKGAGTPITKRKSAIGAILIEGGHDIVIEDCDISDWGRLNPETGFGNNSDSAIFSRAADVRRLIIQRCKMHHPTCDGSTWYEPVHPTHTAGPQCISLFNTAGNHVIRYCEMWSDMDHMYNDIVGGGSNGSFKGAPGHDSDIYGNLVSHCWDDGLEVEGGNRNVRVWGNYITQSMIMIGNAATSIGPLYVWGNVGARSQKRPGDSGGPFLKMGYANSEDWMTGLQYIFHNTIFGPAEWRSTGGLGGTRIVKHTISRNNILHVRSAESHSASANGRNSGNDFDYDLFNGKVPEGSEAHGVRGEPVYGEGGGLDPGKLTGRFQLDDGSPGAGAGERLPNFSGVPEGQRPDMGAHQRGAAPMRFGVGAGER